MSAVASISFYGLHHYFQIYLGLLLLFTAAIEKLLDGCDTKYSMGDEVHLVCVFNRHFAAMFAVL
jgi:hypothetical protein